MPNLNELISRLVAYLEVGMDFIISYVLTVEGIIALVFGMFLISLISRIRS